MIEFNALDAIVKMAAMAAEIEIETHKALERAARVVEKEAKAELGNYQSQTGPFASWPELADRTKDDRVANGYTENDPGLASGEMRDGIGTKIEGHEAHVGTDDDKAVRFELGTAKQPPRSFLGGAAVRKEHEVVEIIGEGAVIGLVGRRVFNSRIGIRD